METDHERVVQQAAQILIAGGRQRNGHLHHQSVYSEEERLGYSPVYTTQEYPSVQMSDRGVCSSPRRPFSRTRRLFCLLTVFDFLMMVLLWFFYAQFLGLNEEYGFKCQVNYYTFKTSMFDVVVMSLWRMVLLLVVYGLIRSTKWYAVAFTTLATCAMVICKAVLYDFNGSSEHPQCSSSGTEAKFADFFILLASFIVVWFELWVLDFQVIKREQRFLAASNQGDSDETSPLLRNPPEIQQEIPSSRRKGQRQFYSPFDSPADSEQEDDDYDHLSGKESSSSHGAVSASHFASLPNSQKGSTINLAASLQEQAFVQKSEDALSDFEQLVSGEYNWTVVKCINSATISICQCDLALKGIIFRLEATFPVTVGRLFTEMWHNFADSASWNPTVERVEIIQHIGNDLQIVYTVSNSILVSSRDFVSIRQHSIEGESHIVSDISIEHPGKPPMKEYVRGENGLGGWVIEPDRENPNSCKLLWIVNTDIKLKLCPQNLFRQVMTNSLGDIYQGLLQVLHLSSSPAQVSVSVEGETTDLTGYS